MNGYMGTILRIDLGSGQVITEPLPPALAEPYLGGSGIGIRMAYDELPVQTNPLAPEAKVFIMTGPLTGTALGSAGRYQVIFKSPLTGILCDSSASGHWGSELKATGCDGLVIGGASDAPVYLWITEAGCEIRDASHLWGLDTFAVQEAVRAEIGDARTCVLAIGPAGESGCLYACLANDAARVAGRGGAGAVLGAKKLKAIAVRGSREALLTDPNGFRLCAADANRRNAKEPPTAMLRELGTAGVMDHRWPLSDIPVKNWMEPSSEELCTRLGGRRMKESMLIPHASCHRCPINCSRWVRVATEPYRLDAPGPEYETLGALGSLLLVDDLECVAYAGHLCNLYGIDTISCGATIAFAMECYEKGLLPPERSGGLALTWGNKEAVIAAIAQIAMGEGELGRLLAQGSRRMAAELGGVAAQYTVEVKGLELPMHDPRAFFSWAATYATSPRGACHLHGFSAFFENKEAPMPEWGLTEFYARHSDEHKGRIARLAQNWAHVVNSMVVCLFATYTLKPSDLAKLINLATGRSLDSAGLLKIGDRIDALYRAYNYRCGVRRRHDRLPARVLTPLAVGGAAGQVPDLAYQLDEYYRERQLEPDGRPRRDALCALGLADVARDLYG